MELKEILTTAKLKEVKKLTFEAYFCRQKKLLRNPRIP